MGCSRKASRESSYISCELHPTEKWCQVTSINIQKLPSYNHVHWGYLTPAFMGNTTKDSEIKFEFVGINPMGEITTYHVESGRSFWKMLNGNSLEKDIVPHDFKPNNTPFFGFRGL